MTMLTRDGIFEIERSKRVSREPESGVEIFDVRSTERIDRKVSCQTNSVAEIERD
jgi:hypothetical protein